MITMLDPTTTRAMLKAMWKRAALNTPRGLPSCMICLATSFLKMMILSVPSARPTANTPTVIPIKIVTQSFTSVYGLILHNVATLCA